jgi:hypothetical protein
MEIGVVEVETHPRTKTLTRFGITLRTPPHRVSNRLGNGRTTANCFITMQRGPSKHGLQPSSRFANSEHESLVLRPLLRLRDECFDAFGPVKSSLTSTSVRKGSNAYNSSSSLKTNRSRLSREIRVSRIKRKLTWNSTRTLRNL